MSSKVVAILVKIASYASKFLKYSGTAAKAVSRMGGFGLVRGLALVKSSNFYRWFGATLYIMIPNVLTVKEQATGLLDGVKTLIYSVGADIATADQNIIDGLSMLGSGEGIIGSADANIAGILLIIGGIVTIGWYFYTWFLISNKITLADDLYIMICGTLIYALAVMNARNTLPFIGLYQFIVELPNILSGVVEPTVAGSPEAANETVNQSMNATG